MATHWCGIHTGQRSRIILRSNLASAEKIPKTDLPADVVVSIAAPWPANIF